MSDFEHPSPSDQGNREGSTPFERFITDHIDLTELSFGIERQLNSLPIIFVPRLNRWVQQKKWRKQFFHH